MLSPGLQMIEDEQECIINKARLFLHDVIGCGLQALATSAVDTREFSTCEEAQGSIQPR